MVIITHLLLVPGRKLVEATPLLSSLPAQACHGVTYTLKVIMKVIS